MFLCAADKTICASTKGEGRLPYGPNRRVQKNANYSWPENNWKPSSLGWEWFRFKKEEVLLNTTFECFQGGATVSIPATPPPPGPPLPSAPPPASSPGAAARPRPRPPELALHDGLIFVTETMKNNNRGGQNRIFDIISKRCFCGKT